MKGEPSQSRQRLVKILILCIISAIIGGAATYFLISGKEVLAPPAPEKEINALVFYHWWTSPGESAAINALVNVFTERYPGVAVMPTSVVGSGPAGGKFDMLDIVEPMVDAGEAPDAFQMHAGYEGKPFFDAGYLEQIDYIWESEGLKDIIPAVVQSMCRFEKHYYSVPVNIHRTNVVWYNKKLLDANGIKPATLTTWNAFFTACDKLRYSGIKYPIQMATTWTAAQVFETIVASIGISFYEDWVNGKVTDPRDPRLLQAFETLKTYLDYVNPDNINMTWDEATKRVITGNGAFNIMGDWANGEFKAANKTYGVEYGTFAVPGTEDMYGLGIDVFQHPKGVAHPTNSDRWLRVVGSKKGQDAFNPLKGSIPARTDTDTTKYDAYLQAAMSDFWRVRYMFPSMSCGLLNEYQLKLYDIIAAFIMDLDREKAAIALTSFTKEIAHKYTIVWSLE